MVDQRIGEPVSEPHSITIEAAVREHISFSSVEGPIRREVQRTLRSIHPFCQALARGIYPVC